VQALQAIRDPRAVEALVTCTSDPEQPVRLAAIEALDNFGTVAVVAGVAVALRPALGSGGARPRVGEEGVVKMLLAPGNGNAEGQKKTAAFLERLLND
jgi:hypothetical protein